MNNRPAFLFYTGDWFKITQGLNHKLKGMLLELIIYQYNNKEIPSNIEEISYILNISEEECKKVLKYLSKKLTLINRTDIPNGYTERTTDYYIQSEFQKVFDINSAKSHKNKILSAYGVLMRQNKLSLKDREYIKKGFDLNNYIKLDTEKAINKLTEWFTERLTNIEYEKDNEDEKENIDYNSILEIFHSVCIDLPKVKKLTNKRKKAINAIVKEYDLETIGEVFNKISESDYLNGKIKSWSANFDWIFNKNNFIKILEDNYKNKLNAKNQSMENQADYILRIREESNLKMSENV